MEPIVDILVESQTGSHSDCALLDSGAELTVFPKKWMTFLGITLADCDPHSLDTADGAGRVDVVRDQKVKLTVCGHTFEIAAAFSETTVALLGRDDFFSRFRVTFEHWDERLRLEPHHEPPSSV